MNDQTGNRCRFLIRQRPVKRAVDIANRQRSVDNHRTIRLQANTLDFDIVFVGNIADDFFQNILKRHQPLHVTILVDDDGNMRLPAEKRVELVLQRGRVGHEPRLARNLHDVDALEIIVDVVKRAQQVLGVDNADNIIDIVAPERHTCMRAGQNIAHDLIRRSIGIDGAHRGSVHHDVADFQLLEVEQAAQLVTIFLDERLVAMQHLDRTAQFLLRAQHGPTGGKIDATELQDRAHNAVHRTGNRAEDQDDQRHAACNGKRKPVWTGNRPGFRQHFREDDQNDRHCQRGISNARIAEQVQKDAGGNGGRQNIGEVVADQKRTDQPVATTDEALDQPCALVAIMFERVHPGSRRRRQRRFGPGKEC